MANFHGRSRISARHPEAQAVCDRCGIWYNRNDLDWQFDYAGSKLVNKRILVCDRCMDDPDTVTRGRSLGLPPDPLPIRDPRPDTQTDEPRYVTTELGVGLLSEAGSPLTSDDLYP